MKRHLLFLAALLIVNLAASAQKKFSVYAVGFYNQENLFDTCHDEGKKDYEYLPNKGWNGMKYTNKLRNMSKALADMGTDVLPNVGCAFIGLSEVENHKVLDALVDQAPLKARNMKYVHIEGPDRRGIDCALLYNPSLFSVKNVKLLPYVQELAKDSLLNVNQEMKIFVMGDMNDDPVNKSMHVYLQAKPEISQVGAGDMYNPWYNVLAKEGKGTLFYSGNWNLFDQIVITPNLLNKDAKKKDYSSLKYWKSHIFRRDYLIQQEGQYKGAPLRTTAGGRWLNGYSDHLPVVMYLVKEKK